MQSKGWLFLRILLNHYHPVGTETYYRYLAPEDFNTALEQETSWKDPTPALAQPDELIQQIHYSWVIPIIATYPQSLQDAFTSVLPEESVSKARDFLHIHSPRKQLGPSAQIFLRQVLYNKIVPKEVPPREFLLPTPLSPLSSWNKADLLELTGLLGLYDLAEGLRRVIDKKILSRVYVSLKPKQIAFLQQCLRQHDRVPRLAYSLDKWDGSTGHLLQNVQDRGFYRFAKALCGQDPNLIWYISHCLDRGRGAMLTKLYSPDAEPGFTAILVRQTVAAMNFIKSENK